MMSGLLFMINRCIWDGIEVGVMVVRLVVVVIFVGIGKSRCM